VKYLQKDGFSLFKAAKICGNFSLLLVLVIDQFQTLHKLDALIVVTSHKRLVRNQKIELLQSLCTQKTSNSNLKSNGN
jgi:hypothetical protein